MQVRVQANHAIWLDRNQPLKAHQRPYLGIDADPRKLPGIAQWPKKLSTKDRLKIDRTRDTVLEADAQSVRRCLFATSDAMNRVLHPGILPQRINRCRSFSVPQQFPIG